LCVKRLKRALLSFLLPIGRRQQRSTGKQKYERQHPDRDLVEQFRANLPRCRGSGTPRIAGVKVEAASARGSKLNFCDQAVVNTDRLTNGIGSCYSEKGGMNAVGALGAAQV
jgi:hypothetical protein